MELWKHKKSELVFNKTMTARLYLLVAGLNRPASGYAVQLMNFDLIVFFLSS